jgi:hypothetical protein
MQTEIDHYLTEQNSLLMQQNNLLAEQNKALSQQVDSLKTILTGYSEVEQELQDKISILQSEKQAQQALISALKIELSKIEQGNFSEQLQQAFQENLKTQLQTQLARALNQLDLNSIVSDLVKVELKPIQMTIGTQQTDIEALSKILQLKVPTNFYEDLETQSKQINTLGETVERLIALINNLND